MCDDVGDVCNVTQAVDHAGKVLGSLRTVPTNRLVRAVTVLYERGLAHLAKLLGDFGLWRLARWTESAVERSQQHLDHDLELYQYYSQTSRTAVKHGKEKGLAVEHFGSTTNLLAMDDVVVHRFAECPDIRRIHSNAALRLRRTYAQLQALCRAVTKMKGGYALRCVGCVLLLMSVRPTAFPLATQVEACASPAVVQADLGGPPVCRYALRACGRVCGWWLTRGRRRA